MLIILTHKRSLAYDVLRKALRVSKLGKGVSLMHDGQSPVSYSLASLKELRHDILLSVVCAVQNYRPSI